ncbi:class IIb bacteriocin, lactobin A/cerein 7B family [Nostoc sp.]|uniref:class IIb bacteriocin, lactobin A/cerein 7B family n=1 Tax=Nostoc sp. TaxID=1180 RepID=UPI002FFC4288
MTNVNGLTQPNNQEIILEEISEEELEGVTGGFGPLGGVVAALGGLLISVGGAL